MSNRALRTALAATIAFSLTACGDDNGLGPTIQLSDAQAEEVMAVLGGLALGSVEMPAQAASAIATLRNPGVALATVNLDETLGCPVSGTRHTTGSIVTNDADTQIDANFTQTYTNCAAPAESGTVWTFNTAPSLALTLSATDNLATETITLAMNFNGAFQVSSDDGRSGSCVITLAWNMTMNESAGSMSASVNGTVCGRQVSQTVEISA